MSWYWKIAGIIGGPILIAIVVLSWKMITAGISPDKRSEVKDNLMRLFFGACAIGFAPMFVEFMLFLNNELVKALVGTTHGSLDSLLGNSLLTNITTGNAIATAIVIAMFAYLFVKVNIKFIIREFTIIVFTIFTPIVTVFWILNKRTVASSIWFGQIIINVFMQFIYCFLFLVYMSFLPQNAGWAVSLLWAMMILPLADALQNTMQNLVSRIAGVNNDELANRGIGMGAAMTYTVKSIAYQFKNNDNNKNEGKDIISKVVNNSSTTTDKVSPLQVSNYEGRTNNFMDNQKPINQTNISNQTNQTENNNINNEKETTSEKANYGSGIRKVYNIGKEFMNLGMYVAEGKNFRNNNATYKKTYNKNDTSDNEDIKNQKQEADKIITVEENDINE